MGSPTLALDAAGAFRALDVAPGHRLLEVWQADRAFAHHEGGVLVVWVHADGRRTLGLQLRLRDDDAPAWRRTRHVDVITHVPDDVPEAPVLAALRPLVDHLDALDGPETQVVDPEAEAAPAPTPRRLDLPRALTAEAPSPFGFGRVFVLDLDSDCGLDCAFCSTRGKLSPRTRFGGDELDRLRAGLDRAWARGFRVLRLSGLDPLTHPAAVGAIAHARDLGFEHVHVYTPGPRLGDPALLDALLAALPPAFTLHVPLYGATAATHDRMMGRPGTFEAIRAGLDAVAERGLAEHLILLTVVMRGNLAEMPALRRLFATWGAPVQVFLPFPATRDPRDRFFEVAVSHAEMAATLASCDPPMGLPELLPCVRYRHERDTGQPALTTGGFHPLTAPLGTLFQHAAYTRIADGPGGNTFTIPVTACPHADACALAAWCPRSVYRSYADAFGLEELQPVAEADLVALGWPGAQDAAMVRDLPRPTPAEVAHEPASAHRRPDDP